MNNIEINGKQYKMIPIKDKWLRESATQGIACPGCVADKDESLCNSLPDCWDSTTGQEYIFVEEE